MLTLVKKLMTKILNLKLVILLEYQNIKTFLKKKFVPNWSEKVFVIKKVENTAPHMVLVILKRTRSLRRFTKKSCN